MPQISVKPTLITLHTQGLFGLQKKAPVETGATGGD
jgi:hypothetical protein